MVNKTVLVLAPTRVYADCHIKIKHKWHYIHSADMLRGISPENTVIITAGPWWENMNDRDIAMTNTMLEYIESVDGIVIRLVA